MTRCGAPHPDGQTFCALPVGDHWEHLDRLGVGSNGRRWPNEQVQAAYARQASRTGGLRQAHEIARATAPPSSVRMTPVLAARRREPTDLAERQVLDHLREHTGRWFTGAELSELAGPTGAHAPGELRRAGWPVESRIRYGTTDVWEHRASRSAEPCPSSRQRR